jgi:hypothetical protein
MATFMEFSGQLTALHAGELMDGALIASTLLMAESWQ